MADPPYRATPSARMFDAYYSDEFGPLNADENTVTDAAARKGFRKNRFTSLGNTRCQDQLYGQKS
jgi:hypothetical protein